MKVMDYLRRCLFCCFPTTQPTKNASTLATAAAVTTTMAIVPATIKKCLSASLSDLSRDRQELSSSLEEGDDEEEDSHIDPAVASHRRQPPTTSRSVIVGTIFGHRRGRVSFCVQHDPAVPPRFLFDFSLPTHRLIDEMRSGVLRLSLECQRDPCSHDAAGSGGGRWASAEVWKAYCNGRKVGYAVRRRPREKDRAVLVMLRATSAGAGVLLLPAAGEVIAGKEEGSLMYMRASYERVVGSRDSVSYHLINPAGGGGCRSPVQELSVFLLRSG